jgi:predicted RecA/RadA family phage recombinase
MAQNYIQEGDVIEITAAAAITSGAPVAVGAIAGVALETVASGSAVRVQLKGVFTVPKASGAITLGAAVYLVAANGNVSTTASGNIFMGHAVAAAASGDATVNIRLAQ